jgi:hypothetical protein
MIVIDTSAIVAIDRRAEELDTIAAVLPIERRDELAELLTDQDVETLRHLVNQGMGDNTLRALTSDLAYLEAWGWRRPEVPALAGARSAAAEIRRPSSLGSAASARPIRSRHAGRRRRKSAKPGVSEIRRPACAIDGAPAAGELVDADQMARP